MRVSRAELLATLPPERHVAPTPPSAKVVVLDDDPTGTQTVHGIPVLTEWSVAALATELAAPGPCFYVLTNSRAHPPAAARALILDLGKNLATAAAQTRRAFHVVSRSDSTLRGHFPLETDALAETLGPFDATLIVPAFFDGGRLTINDTHYVADGEWLIPAGETEFARDATFGYRASNLREWVEEKTAGRVRAKNVVSISLSELRGDSDALVKQLAALRDGAVVIVNAAAPADLAALTHALAHTEASGKNFLFRSAASFVAAYAAISPRPLLTASEIAAPGRGIGGLVVAGSYVGKTTTQLEALFQSTPIVHVELAVDSLLDRTKRETEISRATKLVDRLLAQGGDVALVTSRTLVTGHDAAASLTIGSCISSALVAIVRALPTRPRWLIAKGGITSSDLATHALGVRRALVLGQALPGVPVWQLGSESRWPGLAYIVFPGNVGAPDSLAALVRNLSH